MESPAVFFLLNFIPSYFHFGVQIKRRHGGGFSINRATL